MSHIHTVKMSCLQAAMPPVPSRQQMANAQALQAKALGGGGTAAAMATSTAPSTQTARPAAPRTL